jgi:hypothetical protein
MRDVAQWWRPILSSELASTNNPSRLVASIPTPSLRRRRLELAREVSAEFRHGHEPQQRMMKRTRPVSKSQARIAPFKTVAANQFGAKIPTFFRRQQLLIVM